MLNPHLTILGSKKGIALPLATGLLTLLMVASMAVNELIIRSIRSVRSIEASNRAYFAAEGGVEDALYEVAPHLAGYQTPVLGNSRVRTASYDAKGPWKNEWAIESRKKTNTTDTTNTWNEKMFKGQKLILSLYADNSVNNVDPNKINDAQVMDGDIKNLAPMNFSIKFSIPDVGVTGISVANSNNGQMKIDNDQDGQLNEDSDTIRSATCRENPADADCDGKVDEDSDSDPVILWKLTDNSGRSLIPLKGCLRDPDSKIETTAKSEFCEKDFKWVGGGSLDNWSETLDFSTYGENEIGIRQTIGNFISPSAHNSRMQFEFLIVAPMEFVASNGNTKIAIPHINYEVSSSSTSDTKPIPYHYFKIKSDGYYGTYKQSITTILLPKTTVPLFDFTIIQQE